MERYEALAQAFVRVPITVDGVYRTAFESNRIYSGHVDKPTTRCGIVIGLRGEAVFMFNRTVRVPLFPGAAVIGGYNMQLEIEVGSEGFEYCLVHFLPLDTEQEEARILLEVSAISEVSDPLLHQLVEQLQQSSAIAGMLGALEKQTLFYRVVNLLLHTERQQQNQGTYPLMEEMITFIQGHYMEPLTLPVLARRCQLKPKYFSALFQKYAGMGPIDYMIHYRMEQAHAMLLTGQYTVAAVAKSVGYSDPYYFSRLFKKHRGMPPRDVLLSGR